MCFNFILVICSSDLFSIKKCKTLLFFFCSSFQSASVFVGFRKNRKKRLSVESKFLSICKGKGVVKRKQTKLCSRHKNGGWSCAVFSFPSALANPIGAAFVFCCGYTWSKFCFMLVLWVWKRMSGDCPLSRALVSQPYDYHDIFCSSQQLEYKP